ncbi:hypothetical protein [Bradyrhizobium oligotrophicum]|uniref:hypothetical protein n=1 Tax=Bradyrhizobium oligotrophicum TaxID=44255 RepID=UPI003EBFDC47
MGGIKAGVLEGMKPVAVDPGILVQPQGREALEVEINRRMQEVFDARYGMTSFRSLDSSAVCPDPNGCLRPNNKPFNP